MLAAPPRRGAPYKLLPLAVGAKGIGPLFRLRSGNRLERPRFQMKGRIMRYVATLAALRIASAALLAVAAPERRGSRAPGMERLKQADTNGDGLISRAEAQE